MYGSTSLASWRFTEFEDGAVYFCKHTHIARMNLIYAAHLVLCDKERKGLIGLAIGYWFGLVWPPKGYHGRDLYAAS